MDRFNLNSAELEGDCPGCGNPVEDCVGVLTIEDRLRGGTTCCVCHSPIGCEKVPVSKYLEVVFKRLWALEREVKKLGGTIDN